MTKDKQSLFFEALGEAVYYNRISKTKEPSKNLTDMLSDDLIFQGLLYEGLVSRGLLRGKSRIEAEKKMEELSKFIMALENRKGGGVS